MLSKNELNAIAENAVSKAKADAAAKAAARERQKPKPTKLVKDWSVPQTFIVHEDDVLGLVNGACAVIGTEAGVIAEYDGTRFVNDMHPVFAKENRDVNGHRAAEYAEAMLRGQWWFTPDPLVFSTEGYILNGQHRIIALLSNQTPKYGRVGAEQTVD
jgi:hypothetical protein